MFTFLTAQLILVLTLLASWLIPADFNQVFLNRILAATAASPDAIALRIIPNLDHLSSVDWYKANIKTQGSPQAVIVDGFDAIRDGRSVYVNAANIDLANNRFYNNIYLLSFSQNAEQATEDIFGQLLAQWKFNTNITDQGQKDRIRNDTKRLSDLAKIRLALQSYKDRRGVYPKLTSGSYIAGKTLSVWPSWQATLGAELGLSLPLDPINKLGSCPGGYDQKTCWNQAEKKFFTDLNQPVFPAGSRIYFYSADSRGENIRICGQMETNYANLAPFNCFVDQLPNSAPVIISENLSGWPTQRFTGFVSVSDPDEDNLSFTVELVEPADSAGWVNNYLWQWEAGFNGFKTARSSVPGQIIVSAARAGKVGQPGAYKIRFTVNDGKNQANSVVSRIMEVRINPYPMELTNLSDSAVIGQSKNFSLTGLDNSKQPIAGLSLRDFSLDGLAVPMATHGFSLNGMNLSESFTAAQRLGLYRANVYASDPTTGNTSDSFFQINLINHPPALNSLVAKYADNTEQRYSSSSPFLIDNEEPATIQVRAVDPDQGHIVKYELMDNNTGLAINRDSGLITGLESLNYHELADRTYNVKVRAYDQYCAQSSQEACSVISNFNLTVKKYCSLTIPQSTREVKLLPSPYKIEVSGQKINIGHSLADCSSVGNSRVDVKYTGVGRNQAIVFVLDLSKSMDTNVAGAPAIQQLKSALTASEGVFKKLYDVGSQFTAGYSLKVGLVGFNSAVYPYNLVDIAGTGELNNLKNQVNNYSTNYETNTLAALNKAEQLLQSITDSNVDKYIVLMSDGIPGIDRVVSSGGSCVSVPSFPPCETADCPPGQASTCYKTCYTPACGCGGAWPNCVYPDCPYGALDCNTCASPPPPPPHSGFNYKSLIKLVFNNLFLPREAGAITEQTQCLNLNDCAQCGNNSYNPGCVTSNTYDCDIGSDVNVQADYLKSRGVNFYSIYYNTSGQVAAEQKMCQWSNNNGLNCGNNSYFFSGTDISLMFDKVLGGIVHKPKNVKIETAGIVDGRPFSITSYNPGINFDPALRCGQTELGVTYSDLGYLEFSNMEFNYCPAKLHP